MKIEGAIFDLDGVILDSMAYWENIGSDYLSGLGYEPRENLTQVLAPMSLDQSAIFFQKEYGLMKDKEEIIDDIKKMIWDNYAYHIPLKDGIEDLLKLLANNNVKMCIATASNKELTLKALQRCNIRKYFLEIFTCEDIGYGKDRPNIYNTALDFLCTKKEYTPIFEDSLHAILTAKKAGFITIGVFDKWEKNQDKIKNKSDYYIKDIKSFKIEELQ